MIIRMNYERGIDSSQPPLVTLHYSGRETTPVGAWMHFPTVGWTDNLMPPDLLPPMDVAMRLPF